MKAHPQTQVWVSDYQWKDTVHTANDGLLGWLYHVYGSGGRSNQQRYHQIPGYRHRPQSCHHHIV